MDSMPIDKDKLEETAERIAGTVFSHYFDVDKKERLKNALIDFGEFLNQVKEEQNAESA